MIKKRLFKRILGILLIALSFWPLARFCHHQTKGFSLAKIANNTSCLPHQHSDPLPRDLSPLLNQKFYYLDRGLQSFSFVSEDGKVVLKLFNNRYQKRLFWLKFFPNSAAKTAYNLQKWGMAFTSYQLAYEKLQKETGLLFFHPQKCNECPHVSIVDNLGITHSINLSNYAFALQKKATLAFPYLASCAEEKRWNDAQTALSSLVHLIQKKMDLGLIDRDPLIRTNIGFIDGKAIQIDLGPFTLAREVKTSTQQKEEIAKITLSLRHWIENHQPELLPYFYESLR